ncbi:MAG TPA: ATP-binding cassette domain-containing protein [Gaiellaceae bacterium]|nr:ATP-binding cassette domain-containing protein [Gaiellaceae bacterium]
MEVVCRDLAVEYVSSGYRIRPFDGLDLEVGPGEIVLLLGSSGCGKTTLLSVLAGILRPLRGSVRVAGVEVTELSARSLRAYRQRSVGIVFQAFNLVPSLSAAENVEVPLLAHGTGRHGARGTARELLERVGLSDRLSHRPAALSGGEQQRVAFARALALNPPVLLADEPTAHLDYIQVETVLLLLRKIASEGRTVVVATHDERFLPLATRAVEMSPRPIVESLEPTTIDLGPGEIIFKQGDPGDRAYIVEEGEIEIVRPRADGAEEVVSKIGPGGNFGELAPMFGLPRSATARASKPSRLVGLSPSDLQPWLTKHALIDN